MNRLIEKECEEISHLLKHIEDADPYVLKKEIYHQFDSIQKQLARADDPYIKERLFQMFDSFDQGIMHRRTRHKPLGYAGDYLTIDYIYTYKTDTCIRGRCFDRLFHLYEASEAVRNRKNYFIEKCQSLLRHSESGLDVLSVACGSCRDILEAHAKARYTSRIRFHGVDKEPEAIEYAGNLLEGTQTRRRTTLECTSIFRFKTARRYNLIWCAGIFDYLEEKPAIFLLNRLDTFLKPGGQLIFGNFSPKNPTRWGMEIGSQWNLIHRDSAHLLNLCFNAELDFEEIHIESEPLGINLFCVVKKRRSRLLQRETETGLIQE